MKTILPILILALLTGCAVGRVIATPEGALRAAPAPPPPPAMAAMVATVKTADVMPPPGLFTVLLAWCAYGYPCNLFIQSSADCVTWSTEVQVTPTYVNSWTLTETNPQLFYRLMVATNL